MADSKKDDVKQADDRDLSLDRAEAGIQNFYYPDYEVSFSAVDQADADKQLAAYLKKREEDDK